MTKPKVGIVCSSLSNHKSIIRAFAWLDIETIAIEDAKDFKNASHIVLPGVSTFGSLMGELRRRDFLEPLELSRIEGKPILGLCAGMQVLGNSSQESETEGLGWLEFKNSKIQINKTHGVRSFHTGWNDVCIKSSLLGISRTDCFYFNHSYYATNAPNDISSGVTMYGLSFSSMVEKENIIGAQFHPEKSQAAGLRFLKKFSELNS